MSDLIPEGWKELEVREAFELGRGRVISKPEILGNPGIYPVYSSQSTNQGRMGAINTYDFDGEYITWTTDGAYAGTVFHRKGKFNCTNVCGTLKDKGTYEIHPKFVASYLETVAKNHVSYVGNPKLMNGTFSEILFLLPPLPEQQKIATILSSVDKVIETTRAQIDKLKDLKTGMMQELLTKGIGVDGVPHTEFKDSPVGRIPVGWDVIDVGSLANVIDPQPDHRTPPEVAEGVPYVGLGDVGKSGFINFVEARKVSTEAFEKQLQSFEIHPGAFIFGKIGTIGKPYVLPSERFYCLSANVVLVTTDKLKIMRYLYQVFSSGIVDQQVLMQTNTTSQPALGIKKVRDFLIPLPKNENEFVLITEALTSIDSRITMAMKKLRAYTNIKNALMQDLLTGKVRVTIDETEKEPAVA